MSEAVYLSLGSNVGDRMGKLRFGLDRLKQISEGGFLKVSAVYETEPWGVDDQQDYLNIAAEIYWTGDAHSLLAVTQAIEIAAGREINHKKWRPRPLDIDILLFGEHIISSENLTIPHALLTERRFVLQPLRDVAADTIIPTTGISVEDSLKICGDECRVRRTGESLNY